MIWFGFIPFLFYLERVNKRRFFLKGIILGGIFFLSTLYWLKNVTFIGWFLVSLYCALYFGTFFYIFSKYNLEAFKDCFFYSFLWVILEFTRANIFTGFSWNMLYNSQIKFLPLIQISEILGPYFISFLIIFFNFSVYLSFKKKRFSYSLFSIILIICVCGYGVWILDKYNTKADRGINIKTALIQPNIPIEVKLDPSKYNLIYRQIKAQILGLKSKKMDLIVLPETAIPSIIDENELFLEDLRKMCKVGKMNILTGMILKEKDSYYNTAILLNENGKITQIYKKIRLVPFGEYTPLKRIFPFLKKITPFIDLSPGREFTVFKLKNLNFSCLICFEDTFPEFVRNFKKQDVDFLVEITNDAWFKSKIQSYQHLSASIFRSIETRLPILRSANTGITCFILPTGRVLKKIREFAKGELLVNSPIIERKSLSDYSFHFIFFTFILFLIILVQNAMQLSKRR